MKKTVLIVYSIIFLTGLAQVKAQNMENNSELKGYKVGDVAADFPFRFARHGRRDSGRA